MVDIDKAVTARIKKNGKTYELLVDPVAAQDYRKGKSISIRSITAVDDIFTDARKGIKPSVKELEEAFKTSDIPTIILEIIKHGDIPITSQQLHAQREELRKQIVTKIHRFTIDSRTGLPHPPQRIEAAMNEAKIKIEENKTADQQLEDVITALRPIIPIKFETRQIELVIPPQYSSAAFPILKQHKLLHEDWLADGSLRAVIEIPSGITDDVFSSLQKIAHGQVESKILKTF